MPSPKPPPPPPLTPLEAGVHVFALALFLEAAVIIGLPMLFAGKDVSMIWLLPALPFATILGALTTFGAHREKLYKLRRAAGQCVRCGYDLRASPDRCPECGKRPKVFKSRGPRI